MANNHGSTAIAGTTEVRSEVLDWHDRYNTAWLARDLETITSLTDPALTGTMVMMDGTTHWQAAFGPEIDGIRGFFDFAIRHDVSTTFEVYDVIARSRDEAVIAGNKTVIIHNGDDPRTVTQVTLETVRLGIDGQWRLVRYWAEKAKVVGSTEAPA